MTEGVELMGWALFCMIALVLLAEIADMIASALRRRQAGERMPILGGFNLQPRESELAKRRHHKVRAFLGSWGGINKVE